MAVYLGRRLRCDFFGKLNEEFFELLENEGGGWAYAKWHGP
jgi:hypothetical protein